MDGMDENGEVTERLLDTIRHCQRLLRLQTSHDRGDKIELMMEYAKEGSFFGAALTALKLGYMDRAEEFALRGVDKGDKRCVTPLNRVARMTNDFELEKYALHLSLSIGEAERDVSSQLGVEYGISYNRLQRTRLQTLEKGKQILHRVGEYSPYISNDRYRMDIVDRLSNRLQDFSESHNMRIYLN